MPPYILERLVLAALGEGTEGRMVHAVGVDATVVGHRVVLDGAHEAENVQQLIAVVDLVQLFADADTDQVGRSRHLVELADHELTEVLGFSKTAVRGVADCLDEGNLIDADLVVGDITLEMNDLTILCLDVEQKHGSPYGVLFVCTKKKL